MCSPVGYHVRVTPRLPLGLCFAACGARCGLGVGFAKNYDFWLNKYLADLSKTIDFWRFFLFRRKMSILDTVFDENIEIGQYDF